MARCPMGEVVNGDCPGTALADWLPTVWALGRRSTDRRYSNGPGTPIQRPTCPLYLPEILDLRYNRVEAVASLAPVVAPMVKGSLLAVALAWLAIASPNGTVANSTSTAASIHPDSSLVTTTPATPVPEPSTLISLVLGVGLLGGVLMRLRSR